MKKPLLRGKHLVDGASLLECEAVSEGRRHVGRYLGKRYDPLCHVTDSRE